MSGKIELTLWDYDTLEDDIIGSFEMSLNDILEGDFDKFKYTNIYGAPLDTDNKFADAMNHNNEIGSLWKGRILLKATAVKMDKPGNRRVAIKDENLIKTAANLQKSNVFTVNATLYETFFLPNNQKYHIEIQIEDETMTFLTKKSNNKYINWNELTQDSFINKETPHFKDVCC